MKIYRCRLKKFVHTTFGPEEEYSLEEFYNSLETLLKYHPEAKPNSMWYEGFVYDEIKVIDN